MGHFHCPPWLDQALVFTCTALAGPSHQFYSHREAIDKPHMDTEYSGCISLGDTSLFFKRGRNVAG